MKQRSSFLFATWSFLSLYAVAGLCTAAEPLLQHGAPSRNPAQHQAQQRRQLQSSPSQPRHRALSGHQAPPQGEAPSPFGPASPSQLQQPESQHPSPSQSPARRRFAASRRANTGVCTFTVYQVQVCTPDSISVEVVNYLQINTLYAPDRTIAAHLRHQKPISEFNSYRRLLADKAWNVARLKDSRTLTITEGEECVLRFSYGGAEWKEETRVEDEGAGWCEDAEWYEGGEDWICPHGDTVTQRKRAIHCGFPCARIRRLELR